MQTVLPTLLLNLATFQTTLALFLPKAPSNKFSYFKKIIWQLLISDSDNKRHTFSIQITHRGNHRCIALHTSRELT